MFVLTMGIFLVSGAQTIVTGVFTLWTVMPFVALASFALAYWAASGTAL